jgi:hypothetical protein
MKGLRFFLGLGKFTPIQKFREDYGRESNPKT